MSTDFVLAVKENFNNKLYNSFCWLENYHNNFIYEVGFKY